MTDIYLKNRALKIAWINRLLTDIDGSIYPLLQKYCEVPIKYLLECNLSPQDVNHCWLKKTLRILGWRYIPMVSLQLHQHSGS